MLKITREGLLVFVKPEARKKLERINSNWNHSKYTMNSR